MPRSNFHRLATRALAVSINLLGAVAIADTAGGQSLIESLEPQSCLIEKGGKMLRPVEVHLRRSNAATNVVVRIAGAAPQECTLRSTEQSVQIYVPAVTNESTVTVTLQSGGQILETNQVLLKPVPRLVIYVLPHSHTDIGYTEIQSAVEDKQVQNLVKGMELARKTANYPEGARFVWNVEVLWAVDSYLRRATPKQRAEFLEAVKNGSVALNGMYLNELTGLCRPEELLHLFRYSTQLEKQTGTTIDAAMISDVPGYTWGTVTALAQAGIKYFSAAPNYFDRIGDILEQCENKPFYWESASGKQKVLVWIPYRGYAMSHIIKRLSPKFVNEYVAHLQQTQYPYEIAYMRWAGHGDNAEPDPEICDFIKDWNTRYAYPKFIITSTSHAFHAFEERYGDKLPVRRGDWTPYWEDGAGSSAEETALNRANSDRLTQAEALWAMLNPRQFPVEAFDKAWRNVLLYSEHTWGADCSVSDPERQKTKEQWAIKQDYVTQGDQESHALIDQALADEKAPTAPVKDTFDVFNTTSWPRTEVVRLSAVQSAGKERVVDERGNPVPSQRLADGELAFLAKNVPPFAGRRYRVMPGEPAHATGGLSVQRALLENRNLRIRIDERTGGIVELRARRIPENLVDSSSGEAVNDYLFLPGDNLANLQRNGTVKISVKENGPLVASLQIESDAPGCRSLNREVRLTADADYAELIDTLDKLRAAIPAKPPDGHFAQREGKESINFSFPFNVPDGQIVINAPLSMMRPELDQIPGSCKNWFPVSRWVDVANDDYGVTWITLDAPLIEVGGITARMLGSQTNPSVWRKHVERSQRFYSWAMNNHWGTNYRAYQEGVATFRFILRPHRGKNYGEMVRLAISQSQPLIVTQAHDNSAPNQHSLLKLDSDLVLVTGLKPSDDGRALVLRLINVGDKSASVRLNWSDIRPKSLWLSNTAEEQVREMGPRIDVPAQDLVTIRAELP